MNKFEKRSALQSFAVVCAALLLAACAEMGMGMMQMPAKVSEGVLSNQAGMTLYTFDRDTSGTGKSVCNGPCAGLWPAFAASADAKASGDWTIVTRDDGARQWAYKGKPLYTFSKDVKAGDKTGDGFNNNIWHVAKS